MAGPGMLHQAFIAAVKDAYDAEHQLIAALSGMAAAAVSPELRAAFESHLEETRGHIDRLDRVFEALGEKAAGRRCDGIAAIVERGRSMMRDHPDRTTIDARLIASGRRVEHHEIAAYSTLVAWAREIGQVEVADLLEQTLAEEQTADGTLMQLAAGGIIRQAAGTVGMAAMERATFR